MRWLSLISGLLLFAFFSCDEIPPTVSTGGGDTPGPEITELEDQRQHIIVEEYTGVSCIQCPAGSSALKDLQGIHGEQLAIISIHAGDFAIPRNNISINDLRAQQGEDLVGYLGTPFFFPIATVNRRLFDGEQALLINRNKWAGYISEELNSSPAVKIGVEPSYDETNRRMTVDVILLVETTVPDASGARISVFLTEDDVIEPQLTPDSSPAYDPDYKHQHVLRDMLTAYDGDPISEPLQAGATIEKQFTGTLNADWNPEKMKVVVLVHNNGAVKDGIQVVEKSLTEG